MSTKACPSTKVSYISNKSFNPRPKLLTHLSEAWCLSRLVVLDLDLRRKYSFKSPLWRINGRTSCYWRRSVRNLRSLSSNWRKIRDSICLKGGEQKICLLCHFKLTNYLVSLPKGTTSMLLRNKLFRPPWTTCRTTFKSNLVAILLKS